MIRFFAFVVGFALLSSCGTEELRIDNLDWDVQPDPIYRETEVRHARPKDPEERYDPQEYDPALKQVFVEADKITERLVGNEPRDEQFGTVFWATKKQLLAQEYGINWLSPAELNPTIDYGSYGQRRLSEAEKLEIRSIVEQQLDAQQVVVNGMERRFSGEVTAGAWTDDDAYHFLLEGHGDSWRVVSYGVIEE